MEEELALQKYHIRQEFVCRVKKFLGLVPTPPGHPSSSTCVKAEYIDNLESAQLRFI